MFEEYRKKLYDSNDEDILLEKFITKIEQKTRVEIDLEDNSDDNKEVMGE